MKRQQTQGEVKMYRYIEQLVRNKTFKRLLKRLRREMKNHYFYSKDVKDWSEKDNKEHNHFNDEIEDILNEFDKLRKRAKKLLYTKSQKIREQIASEYALDNNMINVAQFLEHKTIENFELPAPYDHPSMCQIENLYDTELSPANFGEEVIYFNPTRKILRNAFPVAILINPHASKRDVLDFIDKRWKWIDAELRLVEDKVLRARKSKISQEIKDYIYERQSIPSSKLKEEVREKFNTVFSHSEINKIISKERKKRQSDEILM